MHRRPVRIYRPAPPSTSSAKTTSHHWRIDWDILQGAGRWENPLMGWASSCVHLSLLLPPPSLLASPFDLVHQSRATLRRGHDRANGLPERRSRGETADLVPLLPPPRSRCTRPSSSAHTAATTSRVPTSSASFVLSLRPPLLRTRSRSRLSSRRFNTEEDAVHFAEKQGWEYYVQRPNVQKFVPKSYAKCVCALFPSLPPSSAQELTPRPFLVLLPLPPPPPFSSPLSCTQQLRLHLEAAAHPPHVRPLPLRHALSLAATNPRSASSPRAASRASSCARSPVCACSSWHVYVLPAR